MDDLNYDIFHKHATLALKYYHCHNSVWSRGYWYGEAICPRTNIQFFLSHFQNNEFVMVYRLVLFLFRGYTNTPQ